MKGETKSAYSKYTITFIKYRYFNADYLKIYFPEPAASNTLLLLVAKRIT